MMTFESKSGSTDRSGSLSLGELQLVSPPFDAYRVLTSQFFAQPQIESLLESMRKKGRLPDRVAISDDVTYNSLKTTSIQFRHGFDLQWVSEASKPGLSVQTVFHEAALHTIGNLKAQAEDFLAGILKYQPLFEGLSPQEIEEQVRNLPILGECFRTQLNADGTIIKEFLTRAHSDLYPDI